MSAARRRPLVALFAALLLPGLGQIYCGEIARGAVVLLTFASLLPAGAYLAVHGPRLVMAPVLVATALAALAVAAWAAVAAFRSARRAPADFVPTAWNRPAVYVAVLLASHGFVLAPLAGYVRRELVEMFKVPSRSMIPAILPGDRFFADKRVGRPGGVPVRRGAIAVFVYPNERTTLFVKRVVALPGDRVDIDGTSVKVNGIELRQQELHDLGDPAVAALLGDHRAYREAVDGTSWVALWAKDDQSKQLSVTVPNGQVFVLGDNRAASQDSRDFGLLPLADVTALGRQIGFSLAPQGGLRWRRTGRLLD